MMVKYENMFTPLLSYALIEGNTNISHIIISVVPISCVFFFVLKFIVQLV